MLHKLTFLLSVVFFVATVVAVFSGHLLAGLLAMPIFPLLFFGGTLSITFENPEPQTLSLFVTVLTLTAMTLATSAAALFAGNIYAFCIGGILAFAAIFTTAVRAGLISFE